MKKALALVLFIAGFSLVGKAQYAFEINLNEDLCLDEVTVVFDDNSEAKLQLGCSGSFKFETGKLSVIAVIINGVACHLNTTTEVTVNDKKKAKSKVINVGNTIVDDLNGLIR